MMAVIRALIFGFILTAIASVQCYAQSVFANVSALRANTALIYTAYISGYSTASDGGEGQLNYVSSDTTSSDNGCTIYVDAANHRYYRSAGFGMINVKWCGAKGDGSTSDTSAINAAIHIACNPAGTAPTYPFGNGAVFAPPGTYIVNGGINMTNISGGNVSSGCILRGSGQSATVFSSTTSTNATIDLTGSSDVLLENFWIRAGATNGSGTSYGLLIAASNSQACNVNTFRNVSMDGWFTQVGVYIYNCSDCLVEESVFSSYYTSLYADVAIVASNVLGATSSYATITTVNPAQSGNWQFVRSEIHDLSARSGSSTVIPLLISGSFSPIVFQGGVIAGSTTKANGGLITLNNSPNGLVFIGNQFYADYGSQPDYDFFANAGNVTGMVVQGNSMLAGVGIFTAVNSQTWSGLNVTGNGPFSVSLFYPLSANNGTLTGSIVDAQGQAVNLGGVVTHNVFIHPGTVTAGTQSNNGSF